MGEGYLFKAADNVMRKSMAALQVFSNREASARLHAVGLAERAPDAAVSPALVDETQRALDMAVEALDEILSSDEEENNHDG